MIKLYSMNKWLLTSCIILATLGLSAQNEVKLKFTTTSTYAGIEVGSKGVKMSIIEISKNVHKGNSFQILKDTSINSDFISFTPSTFNATLNAMQEMYSKAIKVYEVPSERIITAISSGVKGQADKESKQQWIVNLSDSFLIRIAEPNRKVTVIDAIEEGRLSHLGIVPDARRYNTFLIDIGSGNTKGGYFPSGNTSDFKYFQLNWGTKSTTNAIDKRCEDDKTIQNYQKQLPRVMASSLNNDVIYAVNQSGAYNMNDYIAFSGGIAWSASTLLYPELVENSVVPVTYSEVEKLCETLLTKYNSLSETEIVKNLDEEGFDKVKIAKEVQRVHQVFDQKALLAGTHLLLKIMRQFQGVYEGKEFYLVKNGQVGWISAFVTQELSK
jgi:hypothetical protein